MGRVVVDSSRWPLLQVTLPESQTDAEVQAYLDELRVYRDRHEPYAIVVHLGGSGGFSAHQRKMQAKYVEEGLHWSRKYLKGLAFVTQSAVQRGMLTAIFWIQKPASPYRLFSDAYDAMYWAWTQIRAEPGAPVDAGQSLWPKE